MAQAAHEAGALARDLSFKGAVQAIHAFADGLVEADEESIEELYDWLLIAVAAHLRALAP